MTGKQKNPLGAVAFLFAFISGLTMIFSGGCTLYFIAIAGPQFLTGGGMYRDAVLIIGGVPFLAAALVFWLASKYGRHPAIRSGAEFEEREP